MLLDIGTTAHRVARHLHGRSLTVITSNLAVYEELQDDEDVQLILLGGVVRRDYRSLVGFLTEDNLRQVHADRLFLGTSGVRPDGRCWTPPPSRSRQAGDDRGQRPGGPRGGRRQVPRHRNGPGVRAEDLDAVVTNARRRTRRPRRLREAGSRRWSRL